MDETYKNSITMPDIDIVIPLSGSMYLPYLRNCLASISKQDFPKKDIGIIVSCIMHDEKQDYKEMAKLCATYEATLVFTKSRQNYFSRGYALNIGVRSGAREMLAFVDADIYLHPKTLTMTVTKCAECEKNVMAIIPVTRTQYKPKNVIWTSGILEKDYYWRLLVNTLPYARGGFGNAVVRRDVFERIHGHDERFVGWGAEDSDIYHRMKKCGKVIDMNNTKLLRALHQKHGPPPSKNDPEKIKRNRRLLKKSKMITRNINRWGGVRS